MPAQDRPVLTTTLAALLVGGVAYLSVAGRFPSPLFPYSMATVVPGFRIHAFVMAQLPSLWQPGVLALAVSLPIAVVAWLWLVGLRHREVRVPLRSWILLGALLVAVPLYFLLYWSRSAEQQGQATTVVLALEAGAALLLLCALGRAAQRSPSWNKSLAFQTGLFLAIAWCAFPWLGETL